MTAPQAIVIKQYSLRPLAAVENILTCRKRPCKYDIVLLVCTCVDGGSVISCTGASLRGLYCALLVCAYMEEMASLFMVGDGSSIYYRK